MKKWPKDNKPGDFSLMVEEIVRAIKAFYKLERKIPKRYKYRGYNLKGNDYPEPNEVLTEEFMAERLEDQGNEAILEIVVVALQLGIRQGKLIKNEQIETLTLSIGSIKHLVDSMNDYVESVKKRSI